MAVEAHHLHHLLPSHLLPTREVANAVESQQDYPACIGLVPQLSAAAAPPYAPFCALATAAAGAAMSESGVTFGNALPQPDEAPRKRARVVPPLLGAADVVAHVQQQLLDVDSLVLHHTEKMRAELAARRRRHARQIVAAVEASVAKRLKVKNDEIERIGRLNWALEERLRSLYVEAQVWRDLAQSNEAAVNALRGELEQVLEVQAPAQAGGALGAEDAESCCCGENDVVGGGGCDEGEVGTGERWGWSQCRGCGEGAAEVLLLPCRHLCACAPCAAAARACPACGCAKNGSVCVNFS